MPIDHLRFTEDDHGATTRSLVVRDHPELLATADRSRNEDLEWEVRGYRVVGRGIKFRDLTRRQAEVAAVLVEQFDDGEDALAPTTSTSQLRLDRFGVPTAIAADGLESIVAWRFAVGDDRTTIATQCDISHERVEQMLSTVCERTTGFPNPSRAPCVGEIVNSVPPRYTPPIQNHSAVTLENLTNQ